MPSQITIEKTEWAGKETWIICCAGKQVSPKMYRTKEAAQQVASVENAKQTVAHELGIFAESIGAHWQESFFHPMNQDEWVRRFCEWLNEKQSKLAEIRASND